MGFCTEDRKVKGIIPHLYVRENMTVALLPKLSTAGFIKKKEQDKIVHKYIERLKIKTPSPERQSAISVVEMNKGITCQMDVDESKN